MTTAHSRENGAWALIDNEKRRDRFIRRVAIVAWSITLVIALGVVAMAAVSALEMARAASAGVVPWSTVIGTLLPLVDVLWKVSVLVAALSTISIFLRLRTASLAEIQVRLAALEDAVAVHSAGADT
jgi:hypothetical protein